MSEPLTNIAFEELQRKCNNILPCDEAEAYLLGFRLGCEFMYYPITHTNR